MRRERERGEFGVGAAESWEVPALRRAAPRFAAFGTRAGHAGMPPPEGAGPRRDCGWAALRVRLLEGRADLQEAFAGPAALGAGATVTASCAAPTGSCCRCFPGPGRALHGPQLLSREGPGSQAVRFQHFHWATCGSRNPSRG